MKYSVMNARQKKAYRNIKYAARDLIGGWENGMSDNKEGSQEYNDYKAGLEDHERIVKEIYEMAITDIYDEGSCRFGPGAQSYIKDIRFCGKEWLREQVEARVKEEGY